MKNNKGITLIILIIYIILSLIVLGMLSVLTAHFKNNLNHLDVRSELDVEFDKINAQILKEIKESDNTIVEESSNSTMITFTNGNIYSFSSQDEKIYLNNKIKIAEHIEDCNFEIKTENNKKILVTTIQIREETRVKEYVIGEI